MTGAFLLSLSPDVVPESPHVRHFTPLHFKVLLASRAHVHKHVHVHKSRAFTLIDLLLLHPHLRLPPAGKARSWRASREATAAPARLAPSRTTMTTKTTRLLARRPSARQGLHTAALAPGCQGANRRSRRGPLVQPRRLLRLAVRARLLTPPEPDISQSNRVDVCLVPARDSGVGD